MAKHRIPGDIFIFERIYRCAPAAKTTSNLFVSYSTVWRDDLTASEATLHQRERWTNVGNQRCICFSFIPFLWHLKRGIIRKMEKLCRKAHSQIQNYGEQMFFRLIFTHYFRSPMTHSMTSKRLYYRTVSEIVAYLGPIAGNFLLSSLMSQWYSFEA